MRIYYCETLFRYSAKIKSYLISSFCLLKQGAEIVCEIENSQLHTLYNIFNINCSAHARALSGNANLTNWQSFIECLRGEW